MVWLRVTISMVRIVKIVGTGECTGVLLMSVNVGVKVSHQ
jgi:hypothetical protein